MSELSEIKKSVDDLKDIVITHIAKTDEYRTHKDKLTEAHSQALWDHGDNKGLVTKVDRLERTDMLKNWIMGTIFIAVLSIIGTYYFK